MGIKLLTRADDCGASLGANRAIYQAADGGFIKNISLLAPGPYIEQAAGHLKGRSDICFGLHAAINAEWDKVKWGPVNKSASYRTITDKEGMFYGTTEFGTVPPDIDEIKTEWNAQLDYLTKLGFSITYADTHMFFELYIPGLTEEMSGWITRKGLIDHRYYYRPLPFIDSLSSTEGLFEKVLHQADLEQYFYLCHPMEMASDSLLFGNAEVSAKEVADARKKDLEFTVAPATIQSCRQNQVELVRYDEAVPEVTEDHLAKDWLSIGRENFYQVQVLDKDTFQITDLLGDRMYLLEGSKQAVLIDCGLGFPGLDKIIREITDKPVSLLLTHGHVDHIGGSSLFDFEKVYMHPLDREVMEEHGSVLYRTEVINGLLEETHTAVSSKVRETVLNLRIDKETISLAETEAIDLGGRRLEIIYTPGHTLGSVCCYDRRENRLFSGDTVCDKGVMLSFAHSGSLQVFQQSLNQLAARINRQTLIYPGHHRVPLEKEIITEYLACCDKVRSDRSGEVEEQSIFGNYYRYYDNGISLTYTSDKIG